MGYGEVARAAGFPRYSRMVGASLGRSPEPLPWFRVVRSNRTLAFEVDLKIIEVETDDSLDRILWGPQD